jgi:hypothetical protein
VVLPVPSSMLVHTWVAPAAAGTTTFDSCLSSSGPGSYPTMLRSSQVLVLGSAVRGSGMAAAAHTGSLPVHPSIPETCPGTPWTCRSKMAGSPDNFAPARLERAARRVPRPLPGGCHHMADGRGSGSLPALLCCCWLASCTPWYYCKLSPPPHLHSRHTRQLRQQNSAEKAA